MKYLIVVLYLFSGISTFFSQDNPAYIIYNSKGKKVSFASLQKAVVKKKYVFFGELHNDPIAHWLQFQILTELYEKHGNRLIVGSEMFEQDNAQILKAYQKGLINDKNFEDSCRLWPNYKTDYKPMLQFANENKIPWIATNIPRRYASMVFKKGLASLDTLSAAEKNWICPLPFPLDTTLSQYSALLDGAMHMGSNFVRAQAIKDATMAYFAWKAMTENSIFYHLNGSYHSDFHQGIVWYLQQYAQAKQEEFITISTVSQVEIQKLDREYLGKADFIICVPELMTKTH